MKFETPTGPVDIAIRDVVVAGWTGRDAAAVTHHIEELSAIGVAPPSQVPLFYRVSNGLLTQAAEIQVLGQETSGEIEPLVIRAGGETWLGLASDHTDRALEAHPDHPFTIEWHPFQLNPDMPPEGMDRRDYLEAKFEALYEL